MHSSILLHVNLNIRGNHSETHNDILYKLIHVLVDIGMQVFGAYYGDMFSVILLKKRFHTGVTAELCSNCRLYLIRYCRNYKNVLPCCDRPYLLNNKIMFYLANNSVIDNGGAGILEIKC